MRVWPAADELRTDGVIDAAIGVALLVTAFLLGADALWLVAPAIVLLVLARTPIRRMARELDETLPAPPGLEVHGRALVIARQAPEPLLFAAAAAAMATVGFAELVGVMGLVSLFGAAISLGRARQIARWQLRHDGRVLRTGAWLQNDVYYVAH